MSSEIAVGKLRPVLDYWSCEECLEQPTPEQEYYCGICRRLNREVVVRHTATGVVAGSDEAVRVISAHEWSLANQARLKAEQQQGELAAMNDKLRLLTDREDDLMERLSKLERELEEARGEGGFIELELVGTRGGQPIEEELMEFESAPEPVADFPVEPEPAVYEEAAFEETEIGEPIIEEPEPVPIESIEPEEPEPFEEAPPPAEPVDYEVAEPVPLESEEEPESWAVAPSEAEPGTRQWESTAWEAADEDLADEPEPEVRAPPPSPEAVEVDQEIRRLEDEIHRIEDELALIAAQERDLEGDEEPAEPEPSVEEIDSEAGPHRTKGYTLFSKPVKNPDGSMRPFYFFAKDEEREDASPTSLPEGYEVETNARTGMPYLRRKR